MNALPRVALTIISGSTQVPGLLYCPGQAVIILHAHRVSLLTPESLTITKTLHSLSACTGILWMENIYIQTKLQVFHKYKLE